MNIDHPTKEELARVIATLKKNLETWKSNEGYRRFLEVELYCAERVQQEIALSLAGMEAGGQDNALGQSIHHRPAREP